MRFAIMLSLLFMFFANSANGQDFEGQKRINGTDLQVKIIGKGSPVIVLHGGPGLNYSYLIPQLMDLSRKHKLIFFDQRASGRSSAKLDSSQMSLDVMVDDIDAIRTELGYKEVTVLGHSWGGLLAMKYAIKYPQHLERLILVSTVSPLAREFEAETVAVVKARTTKEDSILRSVTLNSDAFKAGKGSAYQTILKLSFRPSFYDKKFLDSLNLVIDDDFALKRNSLFMLAKDLDAYDLYKDIKSIRKPVLIIHGDHDAVPVDLSKKIQGAIPNSRLVVIKNAGHFPFVEQRPVFARTILDFMRE